MQMLSLTLLATCLLHLLWPCVLGGPQHQRFFQNNKGPLRLNKVHNFAWENCEGPALPGQIKSLNVIPDPVCIPGDVTVSTSLATTVAVKAPLKAVVNLEKRIGDIWIKVPCVEEVGSCTYNDCCAILDSLLPPGQPCPEPLQAYGLPCHCPFKAGTYNLPPSDFYIPNMDLPSFLTNGDYKVHVVLSNVDQKIGCSNLSFSLHAETNWF